ncbi:MAG: EAL domain-containing protein [Clostridiaceae bacterium]|nr:EAL domain-containing protein [Clostridiaceae bacterium]
MSYSIAEKYGISPGVIELELTESAFACNMDIIFDITRRLHKIGFRVSIDDFGSGYSSLNMLKDIFIDVVKIDREFFNETLNTLRGKKIIKSIIMMSKDLGIETVAEGVETKEQVKFLRKVGCDLAQGYYYAKPMPMLDFDDLLEKEIRHKEIEL